MEAVYQSVGAQELHVPLGFNLGLITFFTHLPDRMLKGLLLMVRMMWPSHSKNLLKVNLY